MKVWLCDPKLPKSASTQRNRSMSKSLDSLITTNGEPESDFIGTSNELLHSSMRFHIYTQFLPHSLTIFPQDCQPPYTHGKSEEGGERTYSTNVQSIFLLHTPQIWSYHTETSHSDSKHWFDYSRSIETPLNTELNWRVYLFHHSAISTTREGGGRGGGQAYRSMLERAVGIEARSTAFCHRRPCQVKVRNPFGSCRL